MLCHRFRFIFNHNFFFLNIFRFCFLFLLVFDKLKKCFASPTHGLVVTAKCKKKKIQRKLQQQQQLQISKYVERILLKKKIQKNFLFFLSKNLFFFFFKRTQHCCCWFVWGFPFQNQTNCYTLYITCTFKEVEGIVTSKQWKWVFNIKNNGKNINFPNTVAQVK